VNAERGLTGLCPKKGGVAVDGGEKKNTNGDKNADQKRRAKKRFHSYSKIPIPGRKTHQTSGEAKEKEKIRTANQSRGRGCRENTGVNESPSSVASNEYIIAGGGKKKRSEIHPGDQGRTLT